MTVCFLAYVPMFLLPFTRRWFSLDPTNLSRMAIAAACALAGVAALEGVHRVVARRQGQAPAVHG